MEHPGVDRGRREEPDGRRRLVRFLSGIPVVVAAILALSFLLYVLNHLLRGGTLTASLATLASAFTSLYLPSNLAPQSILALAFMGLLIAFLLHAYASVSLAAMVYVAGFGWYVVGSITEGFFAALAQRGGASPEFWMPVYGHGVGDLFLAGLYFLLGLSHRLVGLAGEWAGGQPLQMLAVVAFVNAVAVLIMWVDKRQAEREGYRVPEKAILRYAALGGAFGLYAGAFAFRHKTQHMALLAEIGLASLAAFYVMLGGL